MGEMYKPSPDDITLVTVPSGTAKRQVVCAANKWDGVIILGVRHFCPIMSQICKLVGVRGSDKHEQGFVDQWGNFMSRKEALLVLKTHGRFIRDDDYLDELYSENLY